VIERFWDAADLRGRNGGRHVGDFPKPSDFLVTEDGLIHYAEVKSTQNAKRFPFSNIEKGQRSSALKQVSVGGAYWFYIFTFGLGEWFLMPATQYAKALHSGAASIQFAELQPWR
jgi:penicillin-binding protein-related factor A (putative recombinase)